MFRTRTPASTKPTSPHPNHNQQQLHSRCVFGPESKAQLRHRFRLAEIALLLDQGVAVQTPELDVFHATRHDGLGGKSVKLDVEDSAWASIDGCQHHAFSPVPDNKLVRILQANGCQQLPLGTTAKAQAGYPTRVHAVQNRCCLQGLAVPDQDRRVLAHLPRRNELALRVQRKAG